MNLFLAVRHHSHLQGSLLSTQCTHDMEDFVRSACILFGSSIAPPDPNASIYNVEKPYSSAPVLVEGPPMLSCTEKDVARVFAGVLAHRLAVQQPQDGPLHSLLISSVDTTEHVPLEISNNAGAVPAKAGAVTVHSILAGILHTV